MNNPVGLRNSNQLDFPIKKNNAPKDCYGQRSKRFQKSDGKDYTVNFSRIKVEETDRLTRSRTRSDPNFLIKDFFPIKETSLSQQRSRQREKINIPEYSAKDSKIDEFSETKIVNGDSGLILDSSFFKEKISDNRVGKRDILLASLIDDLEILKNNAHSEMFVEKDVVEFNPTTDLDQMLETSIDPDTYLSSVNQEKIVLLPEITISDDGENQTQKYDTNDLVDQDLNLTFGIVLKDISHQSAMKQFLEMVDNENIWSALSWGSSREKFDEKRLKPPDHLAYKSSQHFETSIITQVPTILLKAEEEKEILQNTSSVDQVFMKLPKNSQQSLGNEINLSSCHTTPEQDLKENSYSAENDSESSWEIIPEYDELRPTTDNECLKNQTQKISSGYSLQSLNEIEIQDNWKTLKSNLPNTLYTAGQEKEQSTSVWDSTLIRSDSSENYLSNIDPLVQEDLKASCSSKSEKTSLSMSDLNDKDSMTFQREYPHIYNCPSTITSPKVKQETFATARKTPTDISTVSKTVSLCSTENPPGIDTFFSEKSADCFDNSQQPCLSETSSILDKFHSSSERFQESSIISQQRDTQSLWDIPAEEFLKEDVNFVKSFSMSGGSIERVFSPTLKNRQTTSKYPGISISHTKNDLLLPIPSHSMQLENFEEPKYLIELVDTPPPLRNYRSPRISETTPNPKLFERQIFRPAWMNTKQQTIYKPKRGRRTRAEMELYREELARKKQNQKKTDMERYIPNYLSRVGGEARNHSSRTQTPSGGSFSFLNKKRGNRLLTSSKVNVENSMKAEIPFMASQMEIPISYPSCSKLGQLEHQVSGSANIINNNFHSAENYPAVINVHQQQLEQDLLKKAEVEESLEAKQNILSLNHSHTNIFERMQGQANNLDHSVHKAQEENLFQTVQSSHSSQINRPSVLPEEHFEARPAEENYQPFPQQPFSMQYSHSAYQQQLPQNYELDNFQPREIDQKFHQFPLFERSSQLSQSQQSYQQLQPQPPLNPQLRQFFPFPRPYFGYPRF